MSLTTSVRAICSPPRTLEGLTACVVHPFPAVVRAERRQGSSARGREEGEDLQSESSTLRELTAERLRTAWLNVLQSPPVAGEHPVAALSAGSGAMHTEDLSALDHHRSRMTRWIATQPSWVALAVRWV